MPYFRTCEITIDHGSHTYGGNFDTAYYCPGKQAYILSVNGSIAISPLLEYEKVEPSDS